MGFCQSKPEEPAPTGANSLVYRSTIPVIQSSTPVDDGAGVTRRSLPPIPTTSKETTIPPPSDTDVTIETFVALDETIDKMLDYTYVRGGNFEWKGVYLAKLVKEYDGDTATFVLESGVQLSIRLARIDTPEVSLASMPKNWSRSEKLVEQEEANISKEALLQFIGPSRLVVAKLIGADKYGRTLAELYTFRDGRAGESINQKMLDENYAVEYDGGTKTESVGVLLRDKRSK